MAASLIQQGHSGRFKAGRLPAVGQIVARVEGIAGISCHACSPVFLAEHPLFSDTRSCRRISEQAKLVHSGGLLFDGSSLKLTPRVPMKTTP
jgi:hypothetical protein